MHKSYQEVDKKYTGCILKTTELLDCVLIGVCAVIRSNMVFIWISFLPRVLGNYRMEESRFIYYKAERIDP